jgi:4-hydroxy-2-oxoglutarate aldolase
MFTGVNLPADAVERLATHQNVVGIKESGTDIGLIMEYVTRTPDDFTVLGGSATTFFQAMCAGCDGAILALAALLPDACMEIMQLVLDNRIERARELQQRLTPLAKSVGSTYGVPGLKAALNLVGYQGGAPRPPLRSAPPAVVDIIRGQLEALGVLKGLHAPSIN